MCHASYKKAVNKGRHSAIHVLEIDWQTGMFLQITRAGRGGQTGLRWREAATQPWGKPLGISWPELLPYSLSMAGWTGRPNMVEIGSWERWCSLLDCHVAWWYTSLAKEVNPKQNFNHTMVPDTNRMYEGCMTLWHSFVSTEPVTCRI